MMAPYFGEGEWGAVIYEPLSCHLFISFKALLSTALEIEGDYVKPSHIFSKVSFERKTKESF